MLTAPPLLAQTADIEWESLNQEVMGLYRAGKYGRAVVVAKKALEVAEKNVGPDHPDKAARAQGAVQIQVTISEEGRVIEAEVISGHPLLSDAALQAAKQWIFKPTELSGVPVKVQGILTFNFTPN